MYDAKGISESRNRVVESELRDRSKGRMRYKTLLFII